MLRIKYSFILLITLTIQSCLNEIGHDLPVSNEEEWTEAAIHIYCAPSADITIGDFEFHLETIDILAFKLLGNQLYYSFRSLARSVNQSANGMAEFVTTLRKDDFKYKIVVLANCRKEIEEVMDQFSSSMKKEEILNLILSGKRDKWGEDSSYMPMWGESEGIKIEEDTQIDNIYMLRGLARIDVHILQSAQDIFKLKEVYLYNRYVQGYVAPVESNWDQNPVLDRVVAPTLPVGEVKITEGIKYESESDKNFISRLYAYEAEGVGLERDLEATCLVLGGKYDTDPSVTYYRVDFKGALEGGGFISEDGYYDPILRNHLYEINVRSVSDSGYSTPDEAFYNKREDMSVSVQTWNMKEVESEIDGNYTLKVSQGAFYIGNSGITAQKISVNSNHPDSWSMDVSDSWIQAVKKDNYTLEFDVNPYLLNRSGYIDIKVGNLTKRIKIQQN